MGFISRLRARRLARKRAETFSKSAYTITVSGTPAGYTRTTSGSLISTPGTSATSGYSSSGGGGKSPTPIKLIAPPKLPPKPTPPQIKALTVKAVEQPRGIVARRLQRVEQNLRIERTRLRRAGISEKPTLKKLRFEEERFLLQLLLMPKGLVQFAKAVRKDPRILKKIPGELAKEGPRFGQLLREDPTSAFLRVGNEILLLKGTGKAISVTGRVTGRAKTILSPKFKGINPKKITFKSGPKGITTIRIGGPVKKLAEPLKKQVELAGKKVVGVTAQADRLVNLIKTKRVIRKPIPGEKTLSPQTKVLLRKFDQGRITKTQFLNLNRRIKRELGQSLLERSLFADPRGRLRPSRLGERPKDASLLDILAGDITFKSPKPQILVFEDVRIAKFPKTKTFNSIKNKLKSGRTLTQSEANALLKFQLKPTGKFKPIGALSKEPEIVLAPGEIIKREKVVARVIINGRPVPIIRAKVIKAKPQTRKLLIKAKKGKLKTKELKTLRKNLKRETGFEPRLSRGKIGKRVVRARPLIRPRVRARPKPRKRIVRRKPRARPKPRKRIVRRKPRPPVRPPKRPPVRPPKRPPVRPPPRPPRIGPPGIKPPIKPIPRRIRKRRIPKKKLRRVESFEVWARPLKRTKKGRKPKLIKVSKVPLTKQRAKDLRNYITDTSLGRTARIRPSKGKPSTPKLKTPKGYSRKTSAKFRRYKIRKGKRVPLVKGRVIERGKHLLDTVQEKKQITLRRRIAQLSKPPKKRKPVRRAISKPKRKVSQTTLNILKAGREKRLANLKKRK